MRWTLVVVLVVPLPGVMWWYRRSDPNVCSGHWALRSFRLRSRWRGSLPILRAPFDDLAVVPQLPARPACPRLPSRVLCALSTLENWKT